jgi:hypothetical protein
MTSPYRVLFSPWGLVFPLGLLVQVVLVAQQPPEESQINQYVAANLRAADALSPNVAAGSSSADERLISTFRGTVAGQDNKGVWASGTLLNKAGVMVTELTAMSKLLRASTRTSLRAAGSIYALQSVAIERSHILQDYLQMHVSQPRSREVLNQLQEARRELSTSIGMWLAQSKLAKEIVIQSAVTRAIETSPEATAAVMRGAMAEDVDSASRALLKVPGMSEYRIRAIKEQATEVLRPLPPGTASASSAPSSSASRQPGIRETTGSVPPTPKQSVELVSVLLSNRQSDGSVLKPEEAEEELAEAQSRFRQSNIQYLSGVARLKNNNFGIQDYSGELGVKYVQPDGQVFRNDNSPPVYTLKCAVMLAKKLPVVEVTFGWGGNEEGAFDTGLWSVELWWEGRKIGESRFQVYSSP